MDVRLAIFAACLLLPACVEPADEPFRSAFVPTQTAARMGDDLRQRLIDRFPPGTARLDDAERYLADAGATCRPDLAARRCSYTLLRPLGAQGAGPLEGQKVVQFDVDLVPEGDRVRDIQVLVD